MILAVLFCAFFIPVHASGLADHTVTVDNIKLHYVESGTGQAVVLIHGNAGSAADFENGVVDALSDRYRVIAIDCPGHGESDRPADIDTVEDQAKLLHDELMQLKIERPIVVGHSWGGSVALAYTLAYPSDISAMVLVAPAAYPDRSDPFFLQLAGKVPFIGELGALLGRSVLSRGMVKRDLARAFYPQPVPEWYFKTVLKSWLGRKQLKAYFEDEAKLNDSLRKMMVRYPEIQTPTVIITGDKDQIVDAKRNAHHLHKVLKTSRLVELSNTGHEIPQTHPESIAEALALITARS
ncbi:MAG: alpha/beta hydrolase [Acidobacteria bacterium]|nr:alpha/beta hydrolase [Acidobacteriota bacterium]